MKTIIITSAILLACIPHNPIYAHNNGELELRKAIGELLLIMQEQALLSIDISDVLKTCFQLNGTVISAALDQRITDEEINEITKYEPALKEMARNINDAYPQRQDAIHERIKAVMFSRAFSQ